MLALVTGGSGSGKSAFAEALCVKLQAGAYQGEDLTKIPMLYIATMFPFDEEAFKKIDRHKELRKTKNFDAVECFTHLERLEREVPSTILLEDMSNLVANEMYQEGGGGEKTPEGVLKGIEHLLTQSSNLVIVTTEIFSDGIEYDPETARFQDYLGQINREIAGLADMVVEVVYGIPLVHKGDEQIKTLAKTVRDGISYVNSV